MQKNNNPRKLTTPKETDAGDVLYPIRLNRYIANAGICSRRDADQLIAEGKIKINGNVVLELGTKVERTDKVSCNGKAIQPQHYVYVLLNKPKDFLTTMDDPENRKTVMSLVKDACEERIYPVGRLDRNTTGLLVLTNDGELSQKLTHPSYKIKKIYQVDINKPLMDEDLEKIANGLKLEDGEVTVDEIVLLDPSRMSVGIRIHVGKNRIVRRIFEHLGYEVVRLDRTMYGSLTKKNLARGKWRKLTEREVTNLKNMS